MIYNVSVGSTMYKEEWLAIALCIVYCCGDDPLNNITLIVPIFLCMILISVILLFIVTWYLALIVKAARVTR